MTPLTHLTQDGTAAKASPGFADPARRDVVIGLLGVSALALLPWSAVYPASNETQANFDTVSRFLTGSDNLRGGLAGDILSELLADDPGLPAKLAALRAFIKANPNIPAHQLNDSALAPELKVLARQIATGWFFGVVGEGFNARVVTYVQALNAEIVEDVLEPQSFCLGNPGVWAERPTPRI